LRLKEFFALSIIVAGLFSGIAVGLVNAQAVIIETKIITDPAIQYWPDIYDDIIVWTDYREGNSDIFMYDLSTQLETQITNLPHTQQHAVVHGDIIVWYDGRNGNFDIYMYDLSTETETQITTDPANQWWPAVYGDIIVWTDTRNDDSNDNYDIYMYDLTTKVETQITDEDATQEHAAIYGDRIVWKDNRFGTNDIFMYDLAAEDEIRITTNAYLPTVDQPAIYGDRIVWHDQIWPGSMDIFMYDLSTSTETQITTDAAYQGYPDIYGDIIVWQDLRNGNDNYDIYMYDLSTETETQITTDAAHQAVSAVYDNRIVWTDSRNGNPDIYMGELGDNVPPVADAGPDQTVPEDTLVAFDGSGSSDNVGIVSYVWMFWDGAPQILSGKNPTYTFATPGTYLVTLKVSDAAGNNAADEVTITVLTPKERTQRLIETIETWKLSTGTEASLTSKLKGAIHLLNLGNEKGAIRKLTDFISQVEALKGNRLTLEQANYLISEAEGIINNIQG
jgi:beta propeller repeat protein